MSNAYFTMATDNQFDPHLALFSLRTESDNPDATCELSP